MSYIIMILRVINLYTEIKDSKENVHKFLNFGFLQTIIYFIHSKGQHLRKIKIIIDKVTKRIFA